MEVINLEAAKRTAGKTATKAVRREGYVPAVVYGSEEEPMPIKVAELDLRSIIFTDIFHRVSVNVDDKSYECILKDVDFHPVTDRVRHADFQVLHPGQQIKLSIPVHFEGTAIGQKEGGLAQTFVNEITIKALPKDLPSYFVVDISEMKIGDSVMVQDLDREGIEILTPHDQTLVTITVPRAIIELEEADEEALLEGEEGELAEGEEGAEGAEGADEGEDEKTEE
ncbi:MAG: 50S ribosomal protein L25 [Rhodothermales bacterium]|nr:50S ribosomal protein L25 [Rhodothermales bacterium]